MPKNCSYKFPEGALARPDYQPGNYLLPDDLETGQQYLQQRMRRHNRLLHGAGVVCGMSVTAANDPAHPWGVYVCPGYAIGPYGDEIEMVSRELLDISDFLWMNFTAQGLPGVAFVAISYTEELIKPVAAPTLNCQCTKTSYIPSRIMDSHKLSVSWAGLDERPFPFSICNRELVRCAPCPPSPYLLIARISLPASVGSSIVAANIVNL
jgi:hypothetical protein